MKIKLLPIKILALLFLVTALLTLTSCSSKSPELRPQLATNAKLRSLGNERAEREIDKCLENAKSGKIKDAKDSYYAAGEEKAGRNPKFEHKVNRCLREKGYNPIAWK